MAIRVSGLHHVTAIGGDPRRNAGFYLRTLGLRLVKTTVNFDDPGSYHLYYGAGAGRPGTLMTFFPWPEAQRGRVGTGRATTTVPRSLVRLVEATPRRARRRHGDGRRGPHFPRSRRSAARARRTSAR